MVGHQGVTRYVGANYVVISPVGELDLYSTPEFRSQIDHALAEPGESSLICCDLSGVDFIDSSALGELVRAQKASTASQVGFCLVGANGTSKRILRWTQLDTVIPSFATIAEALVAQGR